MQHKQLYLVNLNVYAEVVIIKWHHVDAVRFRTHKYGREQVYLMHYDVLVTYKKLG